MGFSYRKIDDRRYYYEQPQIIEQRHKYLRRIMQNRVDKKPVVFLDETWANAHDGKDMAWVEDDPVTGGTLGGVRRPSGKGKRLIILGAGGEMGWIPNTTLIFQSKKNTGDYHDEMTGEHFEEWFRDKLLPNVPPNSLIVMDNASYHSRRCEELPVKSWTKKRLIEWLDGKGYAYPPKALKSEIYSIIQGLRLTPRYIVDEMALAAGHEVVRLPVAHCTLNPIEMAWSRVKGHIKDKNRAFTLTEVERLAWEGFEVVTPDVWADLVKHVRDKVEDHFWAVDGLAELYSVRELTIRIRRRPEDDPNEESSSESDAASDSDSDGDLVADDDVDICLDDF